MSGYRSLRFQSRTRNRYSLRLFRLRVLNNLTRIVLFAAVGFSILSLFLFFWFSRDLPQPDRVSRKTGFSTVILDKDGKTLYDIYQDKNRIPVTLSDIPKSLKQATVSIEDKEFYTHQGFDPKGILRAIFHIVTFQGVQGGSTLTQQLVKNVLLTSERSLTRKIKEFILAVQIERHYSKDEILRMYLNEAPYGGTMWGIESASEGYFGKHAKDLTVLESAILAGMPQSPSVYSPFSRTPKAYIARTEEVLRRMREDGYITQAQEYDFRRQLPGFKFAPESAQFKAPHFILYVKQQLIDKFGVGMVEGGGLKVTTTLDGDLQEKSEAIVTEEMDKLKGLHVGNGAALVVNPKTGAILAYIGSRNYNATDDSLGGKFDVVSLGLRQPGSALKPFTYATAFAKGYTPASVLMDVETHFPAGHDVKDYVPHNYDGKYRGPIQVRFALGGSINIPAVKMTALIGIKDILSTSYKAGLSTLAPSDENVKRFGLSMTLGGGEVRLLDLTSSYGVFATGGVHHDIYAIEKVTDNNGKVLYEHQPTSGNKVLGSDVTFLISHILSDNEARKETFGPNSFLKVPGKTVAVKTGTTDDKRDNWTVGYTPSVVAGVWVGNNDSSPMNQSLASGVTGAAPIWNRIIREALKNIPDEQFAKPDNVNALVIDAFAGGLPHPGRPTRSEYFIKGTEPTSESSIYQKIKISKSDSNKLANPFEIATGNYDEKEFVVFKENDPVSTDGKNRWQDGINAWLSQQGDSLFHPPSDTSSANENSVAVKIIKPSDNSQTDSNSVEIVTESRAIHDIKKMEIYVDESLRKTDNNNFLDETLNIETGTHKIKVKAYDDHNNTGETEITIGVKVPPGQPTSTPVPAAPTPTAVPVTTAPTPTP